ncbi:MULTISPECIES: alkaline phosphatase family protein [unclassified Burkholderia]|uniref:alkaline phosphatase family protein n=1 Tax=unclassified Burkholderia TaxID=2613784 RepID=UPI000F5860AD|nr:MULTISPECIES: alkaline phosphatase family protein [unclassified Burkholderia]RQR44161.1 phosphoesterase [Burkholderia sp. Bp9131]RQR70984.1 phosphoesterase [Burkholderia sp. Bp9015]RQR80421.1 phosphoesterase [Burkholderia sp. Bp9011]RQR89876.1 phosphoesterase [Burkholderia sp. Bp9010]RQR97688.1 phosphoesterase [Burkholderia sp. Bp8994]
MDETNAYRRYDRRRFLAGVAAVAGSVALPGCGGGGDGISAVDGNARAPSIGDTPSPNGGNRYSLPRPALPDPASSGIDHIVLVTMENRSFDHFMSWVPGAEGMPANRQFRDAFGGTNAPFPLSANPAYGYQACAYHDPNHTYQGARTQLAAGEMNGWLLTPGTSLTQGDLLPIGYYTSADLPFFSAAASSYTIGDFYFSGVLTNTFPNRLYLHSGATDRLTDTPDNSSLRTIWDNLSDAGIGCSYYYHDVPFTALYGTRYLGISHAFADFLANAAAGTLPPFCMVDPVFAGELQGASADDHPHADIRDGQAFLNQVYDALRTSPTWNRTLMIVVYDEWGGFLEHAVPPIRPISNNELALGNDGKLGFRVPLALLGPRVRAGSVTRYPFDPSSIHALLQWRFGLKPLGVRGSDPATFNLAYALDFNDAPRTDAPAFTVPQGPFGGTCPGTTAPSSPGSVTGVDPSQMAANPAANPATNPAVDRFAELRAKAAALGFRTGG